MQTGNKDDISNSFTFIYFPVMTVICVCDTVKPSVPKRSQISTVWALIKKRCVPLVDRYLLSAGPSVKAGPADHLSLLMRVQEKPLLDSY